MNQHDSKIVDRHDFLQILCGAEDLSVIPLLVTGVSMEPTLLNRRSVVYLEKNSAYVPRRGDIVLFLRPDGCWVLHRIVGQNKDGMLIINGDGQTWKETIHPAQVMARVIRIKRRNREFSVEYPPYRFYVRCWMPLRLLHHIGARLCHIWHRIPYKLFPKYMEKKNHQKQP